MRRALLPALVLAIALPAAPLRAEVRHCVMPNGTLVYTDQRCESIGAQPSVPSSPSAPQLRSYRPACPRTLRDLAFEVSASVQSRDVNRLAGVYLWNGYGTREGYALMERLQAVVDRPLVDLQPVYAGGEAYPPDPPRPPVALRLEQTTPRGGTPMHAVFGVRKYLDCWWIVEGGTKRASSPAPADEAPARADSDAAPAAID